MYQTVTREWQEHKGHRVREIEGVFVMGMYTQLFLDVRLKPNTPTEIIKTLNLMIKGESEKWGNRLDWCFNSASCYFAENNIAKLEHGSLLVLCDFKDYDDEIEQLITWLKPYIDNDGMFGYTRYEEDEEPTILYMHEPEKLRGLVGDVRDK